jgi:hypothetical protein
MEEKSAAWAGLVTISVCTDECKRSTEASQRLKVLESIPLSRFLRILPYVSAHLETLSLKIARDQSHLKQAMDALAITTLPKLSAVEFISGPYESTGLDNVPSEHRAEYGRILSSLPSLREIRIPETVASVARCFTSIVYAHVSPLPEIIILYQYDIEVRSHALTENPFDLKIVPDAYQFVIGQPSGDLARNDGLKLRRAWFTQLTQIAVGFIAMRTATLLHYLAASGTVRGPILELAIQQSGADAINLRRPGDQSWGMTPLHVAIGTNQMQNVEVLLKKFDPDLSLRCFQELNPIGYNALELACALQFADIVELLLSLRLEYYERTLEEASVVRLYTLAQRKKSSIRPANRLNIPYVARAVEPPPDETMKTIAALEKFLGSQFPLARLTEPSTGRNVAHYVLHREALGHFKSIGVDFFAVDYAGLMPCDYAMEGYCQYERDLPLVIRIMKLSKAPLEPNTEHLRRLLRALASIRSQRQNVIDEDPILFELEKKAWEIASKADIEAKFFRRAWEGSPPFEASLASMLVLNFTSGRPFLREMKRKNCNFSTTHYYAIEEWLWCALIPDRNHGDMTKMDCLNALEYALQSLFDTSVPNSPTLRRDMLERVCYNLWRLPSNLSAEDMMLVKLANIMVAGYVRLKDMYPLQLACVYMLENESIRCAESRELKAKIMQAASNFALEDEDLTETLLALVRGCRPFVVSTPILMIRCLNSSVEPKMGNFKSNLCYNIQVHYFHTIHTQRPKVRFGIRFISSIRFVSLQILIERVCFLGITLSRGKWTDHILEAEH